MLLSLYSAMLSNVIDVVARKPPYVLSVVLMLLVLPLVILLRILQAIITYHFFDFDVCVVIFNVSYIESFYEKYSMFGKSKILCMSFSVIEAYDL